MKIVGEIRLEGGLLPSLRRAEIDIIYPSGGSRLKYAAKGMTHSVSDEANNVLLCSERVFSSFWDRLLGGGRTRFSSSGKFVCEIDPKVCATMDKKIPIDSFRRTSYTEFFAEDLQITYDHRKGALRFECNPENFLLCLSLAVFGWAQFKSSN